MELDLKKYRSKLDMLKGQKESIVNNIEAKETQLKELLLERDASIEARTHIQQVAKNTLQKLKVKLEEIVTLALQTIITDQEYSLDANFYIKNNRPQCELSFLKMGEKTNPMDDEGYGAVNIAAFALRISLWNISNPKTDSVLIIDEPFKDLSEDYIDDAFAFMKEISHKLGIQIICVTHEKGLIEQSDKLFNFSLKKEELTVGTKRTTHLLSHVDTEEKVS